MLIQLSAKACRIGSPRSGETVKPHGRFGCKPSFRLWLSSELVAKTESVGIRLAAHLLFAHLLMELMK